MSVVAKVLDELIGEEVTTSFTPIIMLMPLTDDEITEVINRLQQCMEYDIEVKERQMGFPGTGTICIRRRKNDNQNSSSQLPEASQVGHQTGSSDNPDRS